MKISYLVAGAGSSFCGACKRDLALLKGLRARGHDALAIEMYTPLRAEDDTAVEGRVFYGGVNVWLQQHFPLFRHVPRFLRATLDVRPLLRWAGRFALETRPEELGPMTVSVLAGDQGRQRAELDRLTDFLKGFAPDAVCVTNSLLSGVAPRLRKALSAPIVCGLQGEESFVERLGQPWRDRAVELMQRNASAIDLYTAPSRDYAVEMTDYLGVSPDRVRVVRAGIDLAPYAPVEREPSGEFRIGVLSRVSPAKGLDILCDAFKALGGRFPQARLVVAGQTGDPSYWKGIEASLAEAGLAERVSYLGEVSLERKVEMLQGLDAFCLPSRFPERRGVAVVEAMACGAPVVVPNTGIFPEMVGLTGGGLLVEPESPQAVERALESLVSNPERARDMGRRAAAGARSHYNAESMVEEAERVFQEVAATPKRGGRRREDDSDQGGAASS